MKLNINIVTRSEEINRKEWNDFILNHPDGNIFHTPEMFGIYEKTKNNSPLVVACFNNENNELVGILVSVVLKENSGLAGKLSARSIIMGGPLCKDNNIDVCEKILFAYNTLAKRTAIYTQVRCMTNTEDYKALFNKNGYTFEEHLNILVDLTKTEDVLWKEVNSKRRNEIRKSEKAGTIVKPVSASKELNESILILKEVYKRAKLPIPDSSLFINCFTELIPRKLMKVFGAYSGNKLIGVMILFTYKNQAYDWFAGSYREHYNKHPNDILPWEIFRQLKQENFTLFDFGGAGNPHKPYKVRDYKKQFGGSIVNYGRYEIIHQPLIFQLAKLGFKFWQKFK